MEANVEKSPSEQAAVAAAAGAIASAIATVSDPAVKPAVKSVPTKKPIPSKSLFDILRNEQYMKALQPLIADVVFKAASIDDLRKKINELFQTVNDRELARALKNLKDKLQSIYENKQFQEDSVQDFKRGGKRRRTKKRKHYKKRRSTKHR